MRTIIFIVILMLCLVACESEPPAIAFEDLPPVGDVMRGAEIFEQSIDETPACSTCHRVDDTPLVGPGLGDYGNRAGERVNDQSAEEYTYNSIVRPANHLVTGFSNVMYNAYDEHLTAQDIADLIAYLLSL